ncbi:MAG TPA: hypothetical protein VI997_12725 [Candidatus Thermoplasmatota archaeon]|nr:hypothetical protein [Candidatus Thermoplasmatota archaeon]
MRGPALVVLVLLGSGCLGSGAPATGDAATSAATAARAAGLSESPLAEADPDPADAGAPPAPTFFAGEYIFEAHGGSEGPGTGTAGTTKVVLPEGWRTTVSLRWSGAAPSGVRLRILDETGAPATAVIVSSSPSSYVFPPGVLPVGDAYVALDAPDLGAAAAVEYSGSVYFSR